jgi:hypothetical protein
MVCARLRIIWFYFLLIISFPFFVTDLQQSVAAENNHDQSNSQDLAKELAQTIAPLFNITLRDYYVASRWNRPDTANIVELQTTIPFEFAGQKNILRSDIPFRTASELGPGLSDTNVFDLIVFPYSVGFWGIGPILNFGINKGPGIDTLQAGPAAAFVITSAKRLSVGVLNKNLFSENVALSTLQPILQYKVSEVVTIGLGDLPLVYDWKNNHFAVVSLGIKAGVLFKVGQQPIGVFVDPQFNTKSNSQLYHWTIATGVTLPLKPLSGE